MNWKSLLLAATLPFMAGCSLSGRVGARYEYRRGYFQTPNGGKDISTSNNRPTWREVNLETELMGRDTDIEQNKLEVVWIFKL